MATRRRTFLLACALGFSAALAPASVAAAAPAQDGGATFGGVGAETTTTVVAATASTTSTATSESNSTLVESEKTPDQPLFTENRKVAAVIGGLLVVALLLLLLTIRYWRVTKPVRVTADTGDIGATMLPPVRPLDDDSIFVVPSAAAADSVPPVVPAAASPAEAPPATSAAPGTDHVAADADWEPHTGEHERVEIPTGTTLARPSIAARRKALGVDHA